jgi:hypothetical protein
MSRIEQKAIDIQDNRIEVQQLLFYVVASNSTFKFEQLIGYDALIVDTQDESYARYFIRKIRSHRNPEFYLKPLFLLNPNHISDPYVKHLNDGIIFNLSQLEDLVQSVKEIFLKTTQLNASTPTTFESQTLKKTLDYLYTRSKSSLTPVISNKSSIGYLWPEVSVHFDEFKDNQVIELLEWAAQEKFFKSEFIDRVYLCGTCSNGFMLYREVCPGCGSADVTMQDNIHHFPCAYVGPSSDFRINQQNALECPKCNKSLRHIGVDYDKPSSICHCNHCDKNFQDMYVKAKCMSCHSDTEVQYLVTQNINAYHLASNNTLLDMMNMLTTDHTEIAGTIKPEIFRVMLHYQKERVKNNSAIQTYYTIITPENYSDLMTVIGSSGFNKLFQEMIEIVRAYLNSSDFISVDRSYQIHICAHDLDTEKLTKQNSEMVSKLQFMISNNIQNFEMTFKVDAQQLTEGELLPENQIIV